MKTFLILIFFLPTIASAEENLLAGSNLTLGSDFGYSSTTERRSGSSDKDGIHIQMKALGTYYRDTTFFEIGVGYYYNEIKGQDFTIQSKSALVEATLAYRVSNKLSLGVTTDLLMGIDNSFSEFTYPNAIKTLAGLQVDFIPSFYEDKNKFRFNIRVLKSLNLDDRDLYVATVGFSYSFPFGKKQEIEYITKNAYTSKSRIRFLNANDLRATLDANTGLNFDTESVQANINMLRYCQRLAYFLKKYDKEWKQIRIGGHTDDVGRADYNQKLSYRRANTVKSILIKEGINPTKVVVSGFGSTRPKNKKKTKSAREENRRVEIDFYGLSNPKSFKSTLEIIE